MIRALILLGIACFAAAVVLVAIDSRENGALAIALLLASIGISILLAIRSAYHKARGIVRDAHAFATGDIQHARLVEVGDPKGILNPESTVVLELEDENGTVHRLDRDVPVPWPMAWSYRLGQRFNLPFLGTDLNQLMAFELEREGMEVELSPGDEEARPAAPAA